MVKMVKDFPANRYKLAWQRLVIIMSVLNAPGDLRLDPGVIIRIMNTCFASRLNPRDFAEG